MRADLDRVASQDLRPRRYPDHSLGSGIIDTSVVIDLEHLDSSDLPVEVAVSALTLGELAASPHATDDPEERRQDRLQRTEAAFDPVPFDVEAARAYGRIYAPVMAAGRKARRPVAVDLLIAVAAHASLLPLYTRNPSDFRGLEKLVDVVTA